MPERGDSPFPNESGGGGSLFPHEGDQKAPGREASTPAEALADVLRQVAAGRRYVDPEIAASALSGERSPLTDRELDVLRAGRTAARVEDIAERLHLAPGTVRNHLSHAMGKLGVRTRHEAAERAWEEGWI